MALSSALLYRKMVSSVQQVEVADLHCPKDENGKIHCYCGNVAIIVSNILLAFPTDILYLNVYYLVNIDSIFLSIFYLLCIPLYIFPLPIS